MIDDLFQDRAFLNAFERRKELQNPAVWSFGEGRVDVHVLSYSGKKDWLRQSLESMQGDPCRIHLVLGGFPGSIGQARAFASRLGNAEYCSFTDEDDWLSPGAMQQCVDYLDANPSCVGVYTDLEHVQVCGRHYAEYKGRPWRPLRQLLYCPEITHLKVMRRAAVEPYLEIMARFPTYEEYVLAGLMTERGPWLHLPIIGATKRVLPATQSSMRLANNKLWREAVRTVTRPLMRAHRTQKETTDWASTVSDSRCDTSTI